LWGGIPLAYIDEKTTLEEIKALVEDCGRKGEDINELLRLCAERHPNPATLKILLKAGADVNAKDNEDRTPWEASASTYELSKEDIEQLADLVKRIENFQGDWIEGGQDMNGLAYEAMDFLYEKNLIINFDWPKWDEGREFFEMEGIQKYQKIDKESVLKLLTRVARGDRFSGGVWANLFEKGDGLALFKRLLEIETNDVERK
jgi:hypothetical protein